MHASRRTALFALIAFALLFQGSRGIWDPDEGRYVNVAYRMVASGDWWTPHLHHQVPHFTKPPLTYWAVAASIATFGHNEWAARLPNAAAWVGTVLLVFALARHLAPERELLAAVIQATSLLPFVAMNIVTTDTLLTFCELLGAYGFVRFRWSVAERPERERKWGLFWMWTGFGLAFLTKGPPGLLPLAAILGFVVATEGARGLARLGNAAGIGAFLVLAFGWYAAQIAAHPQLLDYLLGQEVVGRLTSKSFNRNAGLSGLVHAYLGVVIAGMLPWAPWALARWVRGLRRSAPAVATASPPAAHRFLLWWLLLPFAVFLASTSRLPLYLLVLAPPAALLLARALPQDALARKRVRILLGVWLVLLVTAKGAGALHETSRDGRRLAAALSEVLPYPPLEIVVVNRKARYSMAFYLRTEVEQVDLSGRDPARGEASFAPVSEPLADELAEMEPGTIYLVPVPSGLPFLQELRENGFEGRKVGEVDGFGVYSMPRLLPGSR